MRSRKKRKGMMLVSKVGIAQLEGFSVAHGKTGHGDRRGGGGTEGIPADKRYSPPF
jgi:hypothetical protein